ncbi:DUF4360 domain-containing protein [Streptomyces albireticuli]|uniref:DUF4360 domain-containing protein n=1 Tax=Streptomyces albireticuli TaxID=1940 RepID=UPI0036C56D4F
MFTPVLIAGTAAALVAATLSPAPATPGETPPPDGVFLELATVSGACGSHRTSVALSGDRTEFRLFSGEFTSRVGVGSKPGESYRNCQVMLSVRVPTGYTYAIAGTDYEGHGSLEKGARGQVRVENYFQGTPGRSSVTHPFAGPFQGGWKEADVIFDSALLYAPCGENRALNLNIALRVEAGTSDTSTTRSFLTHGSTPSGAETVYHLSWKRCPAA